jgi:hypothetical protein
MDNEECIHFLHKKKKFLSVRTAEFHRIGCLRRGEETIDLERRVPIPLLNRDMFMF